MKKDQADQFERNCCSRSRRPSARGLVMQRRSTSTMSRACFLVNGSSTPRGSKSCSTMHEPISHLSAP